MRTQRTTKGNRDAGSSCSRDRGLHRYLRNFGGGGVFEPPPSVRPCHRWRYVSLAAFSNWRGFCMSGRKLLDPPSYLKRCSGLVSSLWLMNTSLDIQSKVMNCSRSVTVAAHSHEESRWLQGPAAEHVIWAVWQCSSYKTVRFSFVTKFSQKLYNWPFFLSFLVRPLSPYLSCV